MNNIKYYSLTKSKNNCTSEKKLFHMNIWCWRIYSFFSIACNIDDIDLTRFAQLL